MRFRFPHTRAHSFELPLPPSVWLPEPWDMKDHEPEDVYDDGEGFSQ